MVASDPAASPERADDPERAPTLEARRLVREYGGLRALDGVDLQLGSGEILALFGPNGAGKSTLLRILGGGLRPTTGEVLLAGEPLEVGDLDRHRRIGVLSHRTFLYPHLTAAENLRFYGHLFDLDDLDDRVERGLEGVGLSARADTRVDDYSRGMRQRLALARTLLHDPEIVLLDEPYTGLDPHAASTLRSILSSLRDGRRSVVLVTHNLSQGLQLADRVAILVRGRIVFVRPSAAIDAAGFEHLYHETVDEAA